MSQPPSGTLKPFALAPATPEDIHRLTHIHVVSLADDPPAQIKFPSSDNFAAPVSSMLEKQIGDPKWCIMKAVDEETGEIGSWASWLEHSSDNSPSDQPQPQSENSGKGGRKSRERRREKRMKANSNSHPV